MYRKFYIFLMTTLMMPAIFASNEQDLLWGHWIVKRVVNTTNISALSQTEVDRIVGIKLFYSKTCITSGNITIKFPKYQTKIISDREFFQQFYNIPSKQIGISGSSIKMIIVNGVSESQSPLLGDTIFMKDEIPIVEFQGVFFELERVPARKPSK